MSLPVNILRGGRNIFQKGLNFRTLKNNLFASSHNQNFFLNNQFENNSKFSSTAKDKVSITFLRTNGKTIVKSGKVGDTIRDLIGIEDPDLPGYGTCEGTLSCSTCHVILTPQDFDKVENKPNDEELDLIGYAPENCDTSRLGCNVFLTKSMDGMVVRLPAMVEDHREYGHGEEEEKA